MKHPIIVHGITVGNTLVYYHDSFTASLCYYVIMLLCYYVIMLLCYYVIMLLCYYVIMLLCYYVIMLLSCDRKNNRCSCKGNQRDH